MASTPGTMHESYDVGSGQYAPMSSTPASVHGSYDPGTSRITYGNPPTATSSNRTRTTTYTLPKTTGHEGFMDLDEDRDPDF